MNALIGKRPKMNDFLKAVLIVSLVFLATGICGSFIYDENDEPAMENLLKGFYLNAPIGTIDFGVKGISFFYIYLYSKIDLGINYFGVSLILLNWWAFILLTFFLIKKGPAHSLLWPLLFLLLAFYTIFIVSFTTTPILALFAGELLFLYALTHGESLPGKLALMLLAASTIVLAYLVRPASGTLAIFLFVPAWFSQVAFKEKIGKKTLSLLFIVPFIAAVFIGKQIDKNVPVENKIDSKAVGIYSEINNFGYQVNIRDKTHEKLLYEIQNWFYFDKDTQQIKNYRDRLSGPKKQSHLRNAVQYVFRTVITRRSLPFMGILFITLLMPAILHLKSVKTLIAFLSVGYYLAVLVAIALLMKMPPRILMPTLLIAIYYLMITFPAFWPEIRQTMGRTLRGILVFACLGLAGYQVWSLAIDLSRENRKADASWRDMRLYATAAKPEYVFLTWAYDFNYYALRHVKREPGIKAIPLAGWMSYYPQTYAFLKTLTGSNDVKDIIHWIAAHPEKATIYSDTDNNLVLKKIFAYHDFRAHLLPTKIVNGESGKGFYRVNVSETESIPHE
jgi:hypothetical protein